MEGRRKAFSVFQLPGLLVPLNQESLVGDRTPSESCQKLLSVLGLARLESGNQAHKSAYFMAQFNNRNFPIKKLTKAPFPERSYISFRCGSQLSAILFFLLHPDTANFSSDHHEF